MKKGIVLLLVLFASTSIMSGGYNRRSMIGVAGDSGVSEQGLVQPQVSSAAVVQAPQEQESQVVEQDVEEAEEEASVINPTDIAASPDQFDLSFLDDPNLSEEEMEQKAQEMYAAMEAWAKEQGMSEEEMNVFEEEAFIYDDEDETEEPDVVAEEEVAGQEEAIVEESAPEVVRTPVVAEETDAMMPTAPVVETAPVTTTVVTPVVSTPAVVEKTEVVVPKEVVPAPEPVVTTVVSTPAPTTVTVPTVAAEPKVTSIKSSIENLAPASSQVTKIPMPTFDLEELASEEPEDQEYEADIEPTEEEGAWRSPAEESQAKTLVDESEAFETAVVRSIPERHSEVSSSRRPALDRRVQRERRAPPTRRRESRVRASQESTAATPQRGAVVSAVTRRQEQRALPASRRVLAGPGRMAAWQKDVGTPARSRAEGAEENQRERRLPQVSRGEHSRQVNRYMLPAPEQRGGRVDRETTRNQLDRMTTVADRLKAQREAMQNAQ